jgi:hypothetical protein
MSFFIIIKLDQKYYLVCDPQGRIIGFVSLAKAYEYYEQHMPAELAERLESSPEPSILNIEDPFEIAPLLTGAITMWGSDSWGGIVLKDHVESLWRTGRRTNLDWYRKGDRLVRSKLSANENQVVEMLQAGKTDEEIGHVLGVHYQTVTRFVNRLQLR